MNKDDVQQKLNKRINKLYKKKNDESVNILLCVFEKKITFVGSQWNISFTNISLKRFSQFIRLLRKKVNDG